MITQCKSVVLIGTSHRYQMPENPAAGAFRTYIGHLHETTPFRAIAEEMSPEELANRRSALSICAEFANEVGIHHRYCDPNNEQRRGLRVRHQNIIKADGWLYSWSQERIQQEIQTSHSIRERYWLDRLFELDRWPVLFVCGACHIESFRLLAEGHALSVGIAAYDWKTDQ